MPKKTPTPSPVLQAFEPERDGGPREAAHYIKGAIGDLAILARIHRLNLLLYLLDMAHQEADEASRREVRDPL